MMAGQGRPPKPVEQKRRTGNPGQRRLPEPTVLVPAVSQTPPPLRALGPNGLAFWNRVWANGQAWISQYTDVDLVQLVAEQMDERGIVYQVVLKQQQSGEVDWRIRNQLRDLDREIVRNLASLGFSPEMRSRLGLAEVKAQHVIETLITRRQQRGN